MNKTITWLTPEGDREWFPPLDQALDEPEGLLAAGGDLSPPRLLAAIAGASFPGIRRDSRCCGGRPIRAKSCSRRSFIVRAALPKLCEIAALR